MMPRFAPGQAKSTVTSKQQFKDSIMAASTQFRADVQEQTLSDKSIAYNVALFEVGKTTTIIPARDKEDAYARVDAINFAFRGLD